jgi:hypothetical protein
VSVISGKEDGMSADTADVQQTDVRGIQGQEALWVRVAANE